MTFYANGAYWGKTKKPDKGKGGKELKFPFGQIIEDRGTKASPKNCMTAKREDDKKLHNIKGMTPHIKSEEKTRMKARKGEEASAP